MAHQTIRSDGWTPDRQLTFIAELTATRSITMAARAAGMGRESAYRLRERSGGALFAHLWDLALTPDLQLADKGHTGTLTDGQLLRLLGNHYRRESGDFAAIGVPRAKAARG